MRERKAHCTPRSVIIPPLYTNMHKDEGKTEGITERSCYFSIAKESKPWAREYLIRVRESEAPFCAHTHPILETSTHPFECHCDPEGFYRLCVCVCVCVCERERERERERGEGERERGGGRERERGGRERERGKPSISVLEQNDSISSPHKW